MTTARQKIIGTIALLALIAATILAGIGWGGWRLWSYANPSPAATAVPSPPTPSPTATATASSTPTMTPTNTATATATPTVTFTSIPSATPSSTPTSTHTPTYTPTATPTAPAPTATPKRPTPTPTIGYPAPALLEPADGAHVETAQRFRWQWGGPPLGEDLAFDLRIWSEQEEQNDHPKRGAVAPVQDLEIDVDLKYVPAVMDYGPGDYYWTVVVVQTDSDDTPTVIGIWGEKRRFTYSGSSEPPRPKPTGPSSNPTPTRIQP